MSHVLTECPCVVSRLLPAAGSFNRGQSSSIILQPSIIAHRRRAVWRRAARAAAGDAATASQACLFGHAGCMVVPRRALLCQLSLSLCRQA
eukprot:CAMPEP_0185189064 /NCGR_PEP_ID=MMETSP1140-20130426/5800_1 /TAXON_ID=298111 /ORGANISM="Pavlova sp., Strain CCMP459" /LENGTH=90 /DNA_ID=CAMNT_0027755595 /DNA_START=93 /DNA_END=365 /DNA_ORIENTATION=+